MTRAVGQHPRVLALERPEEREAVLALSELLQRTDPEAEDGVGLFDDVGALIRYLRARKWDVEAAHMMIRNTARWRKEFGFSALLAGLHKDTIKLENATGKLYARGYDKQGRPIFYMKPARENTFDPVGSIKHLVYCMERVVACIERREALALEKCGAHFDDDGRGGKLVLLVDFNDYSLAQAISFSTAREVLKIFQDHYPERLGQAFLVDPPWIFSSLWGMISPFVDPVTFEKVQVVAESAAERGDRLAKTFSLSVLEEGVGGETREPFDSHVFLNTKLNGTEFGLEFEEQVALAGGLGTAVPSKDPGQSVDSSAALERLQEQLSSWWHDEMGVSPLNNAEQRDAVARVSALGGMYVRGYDLEGRPIVYLRPWSRSMPGHQDLIRYFIYCAERAVACADCCGRPAACAPGEQPAAAAPARQGKVTVVLDFQRYSVLTRPSLFTIWKVLDILQRQYIERVAQVVVVGPPRRFVAAWAAASRFVHSDTYDSFVVIADGSAEDRAAELGKIFDLQVLEAGVGGANEAPFDSEVFVNQRVGGEVFGAEFEAQLGASEAASGGEPDDNDEHPRSDRCWVALPFFRRWFRR